MSWNEPMPLTMPIRDTFETLPMYLGDMWLGHRLISGKTGSGKTNFVLNEMMDVIRREQHPVTFVAPHEQAGKDLAAELYAQYGDYILDRLVIEQLGDTDKVIPRQFIQKSTSTDYWKRRSENDAYADAFMSLLAARRKKEDFFENPSLEEISTLTIKLFQNQDTWWPEHLIARTLDPKDPISKYAIAHCTDRDIANLFEQKLRVAANVAEHSTRPVARMFDLLLANATMKSRTSQPQTWDKIAFHNNCGILIIIANGCSADALRTYVFAEFQQMYYWWKNGIVRPGLFVVDEVTNYSLAGNFESRALATLRGFGGSIWFLVQNRNFPTPEIANNITTNMDEFAFRQNGGQNAHLVAESLLPVLDEYQVHHTTKKRIDDKPTMKERRGRTYTSREDGTSSESDSYGEQLIPNFRYEDENVYQQGHEQLLWLAQKLQTLRVGQYYYNTSTHGAGRAQAQLFPDSWAFPGLKEAKYQECLQKIKAQAIYQVPTNTPFRLPGANPPQTRMDVDDKKK